MASWLTTGLFLTLLGGFLLWTGQHSVGSRACPERSPGIRVPSTTGSREAWLTAHRPARPYFLASGALTAVAGLAFAVWGLAAAAPGDVAVPALAVVAAMLGTVLVGGAVGLRALARSPHADSAKGSGHA